jgi:hypothetical protein
MKTFDDLDQYLSKYEFDDDDWGNYASEEAHEIALNLSLEGWLLLQSNWHKKSLDWKKLLAGLLDYHANISLELPILVPMIFDKDEDLAAEAAMSLFNIVEHRETKTTVKEICDQPHRLLDRLREIVDSCSGTYEECLRSLLRNLEASYIN